MVYTLEERISIVAIYFRSGNCVRETARIFNLENPNRNVSHQYVMQLLEKFTTTGSVANKKRQLERPVRNEGIEVAVLGHASMDGAVSIRQLSEISGVSRSSVHRILRGHKFFPYKIQLVQELNEDDHDRRLQFSEIMSERLIRDPNLLFNICFSDECSFYLNGNVNRHNCRYWSDTNPHLYRETHTQNPQKLNVWCGILGNHIVGPLFIDGNLTGEVYRDLLENHIDPMIVDIIENDAAHREEIFFQQDGAPPHFAAAARQFLDRQYPDRWIGRRGPIEWPARSPDMTPLDFFLWGHLKTKVYNPQPLSLEDLRQRIVQECQTITPEMFQNVRTEFENRLYLCMGVDGGHFQQLIK